jgi:hypothetical protein
MQSLRYFKLPFLFFITMAVGTLTRAQPTNTPWSTTTSIGINTTSPATYLDVNGAASLGGTANNLDPGQPFAPATLPHLVGTGKVLIGWNRVGGFGESDLITNTLSGQVGGFAFWNQNSSGTVSPLVFMNAQNGNVLIGEIYQTNTAYKLDVSGIVRANEVVVNTTGADFVFDPKYHLLTLAELHQYIQLHHHLPDIAPAAQMQEQGVKLGDNQTRLLQKVEELTLYIIDQDKKVAALQQENKDLKENLQSQIDALKALLPKK